MNTTQPNPLKAAMWMGGAIVSFVLMAVSGRAVQVELNTFELMFWRSLIGFFIVVAIIKIRTGDLSLIRTQHWGLHVTRNVFHFFGQNMWFYGLMLIPLSQLVALEFTNPIWVVLLAPFFLGERLTGMKMVLTLIGFVGVLVVAQPGVQPLHLGHLAGILAAIGFAINLIFTRKIMLHDQVLCVLFWMTTSQTIMALVLMLATGFQLPSMAMLPWLAVIAVTGLTAHFSLTSALGLAPATIVAPMEFARLPIVALVGVWLYGETLDPMVFLGAAIIFSANFLNLRLSTRRRAQT
ncbi:DMT family transporter [Pararhodobacter zhoushanensis]|uniref:DMT family transporter n=1 Tax=Pararhodobacter zhoushanensis TaxID=2479545 RepID=A0ABT3GVK7_9RHOB|nr:DMT family transporter [Pararhodobacter zhoushanensis]MCW1931568.1 DMT family transporter [Pararhodobacter zhoushanensis]